MSRPDRAFWDRKLMDSGADFEKIMSTLFKPYTSHLTEFFRRKKHDSKNVYCGPFRWEYAHRTSYLLNSLKSYDFAGEREIFPQSMEKMFDASDVSPSVRYTVWRTEVIQMELKSPTWHPLLAKFHTAKNYYKRMRLLWMYLTLESPCCHNWCDHYALHTNI